VESLMRDARLRWIAFFGLLIGLPFLLIYALGLQHWIGRVIADAILCYSVTLVFTGYALNPRTMMEMVRQRKKENQPKMSPGISGTVQVLSGALAVFLWWIWGVPFASDVAKLTLGKGRTILVGRVCGVSGSIYGLNFLKKSVYMCDGTTRDGRSYTLFYSIGGPETGGKYELTVLPRSRMLLDAKEIQ
jgi:hypothetical protein